MRLRRSLPVFIFGLSIGLIIGTGFFIFKINDAFNKLKDNSKDQITVIEQPVKNIPAESEVKKKGRERFKIHLGTTPKVNYKEVDSMIKEDSHINIAKDELLSVKSVKIIKIDAKSAEKDSLAAQLASVDVENSDLYFLEFWKTPLNSKGYRFTKNKIMLYGFMDYNNVLLYQLDNSYYLRSSDQVYKLFYGGEFRQLERVVDTELLAKIN